MNNKKQKLELTWIGKEREINLEPRILVEVPEKNYGDKDTENMLIHGDNLLALKALEQDFAGKIKCIYIDPPYNTGSAFEHYDDNIEHSTWLSLMRQRLEILKTLLSDEGCIFVQIDDNEQAYLRVLMDEIFGRNNYVNTVSVNMKNVAGVSGGGEDKRLKKNLEYILLYAKNYDSLPIFNPVYEYTEMYEVVKSYRETGKNWHYTSVLVNPGEKIYVGSTKDGAGDEIRLYVRKNPVIKSVNQIMQDEQIAEKEVYYRYSDKIFEAKDAQTSIRTRVIEAKKQYNILEDLVSIEYVPKTGKNKGKIHEQFYKGDKCRLFAWLKSIGTMIDGVLYKKDLQGTYWDYTQYLNNLTKEGDVKFPNGKKPEALLERILTLSTMEGDYVLDSFLGSGTTASVANKMGRKWIGIELGEHCYTHCEPRLHKVIDGVDKGGISKSINWNGGGGYKFYELAPSLLKKDEFGEFVIEPKYDAEMLAEAMAKHEGYKFSPDENNVYKQGYSTEKDFIFITTQFITAELLNKIQHELKEDESLLICTTHYEENCIDKFSNITVKKIPQSLLKTCEFGALNYNLNVIETEQEEDFEEIGEDE